MVPVLFISQLDLGPYSECRVAPQSLGPDTRINVSKPKFICCSQEAPASPKLNPRNHRGQSGRPAATSNSWKRPTGQPDKGYAGLRYQQPDAGIRYDRPQQQSVSASRYASLRSQQTRDIQRGHEAYKVNLGNVKTVPERTEVVCALIRDREISTAASIATVDGIQSLATPSLGSP